MTTKVPVEFVYDEESKNWGFSIAEPGVVGGGDATLEAAKAHAADALGFALRGAGTPRAGGKIEFLEVVIEG